MMGRNENPEMSAEPQLMQNRMKAIRRSVLSLELAL